MKSDLRDIKSEMAVIKSQLHVIKSELRDINYSEGEKLVFFPIRIGLRLAIASIYQFGEKMIFDI